MKAYDEVIEFIARNPKEVLAFKPSEAAKQRVVKKQFHC